jgi:predicted ATPase with chaperone activity
MTTIGDELAPGAPVQLEGAGVSREALADLLLKTAFTVPQFTTEWAARQTHLPQPLVGELLEQFRVDHLLEVLGPAGPLGYRYNLAQRGRERAARLLEISGYIGPAPVSVAAYTGFLEWQLAHLPPVSAAQVRSSLADLVLPSEVEELAGLAVSSGRSLFLSGPPGNGKTTLGRSLHCALQGNLWVPHCVNVESNIIRIFDPALHQPTPLQAAQPWLIDQRWVRVRRPLVVVGGEATIESFDLAYSPTLRFYEAPVHLKANGGTFLIDDFGRQRVDPHDLLNRWIIPMEHQIDYLALHTGQKVQVPFRLRLIIATNLSLEGVTDPAFLRRMGYRVELDAPTPELYTAIFERYPEKFIDISRR